MVKKEQPQQPDRQLKDLTRSHTVPIWRWPSAFNPLNIPTMRLNGLRRFPGAFGSLSSENMGGMAKEYLRRFHHGFRQGWMRMHGHGEILNRGTHLNCQYSFGN